MQNGQEHCFIMCEDASTAFLFLYSLLVVASNVTCEKSIVTATLESMIGDLPGRSAPRTCFQAALHVLQVLVTPSPVTPSPLILKLSVFQTHHDRIQVGPFQTDPRHHFNSSCPLPSRSLFTHSPSRLCSVHPAFS